jgi:hypothetical protein
MVMLLQQLVTRHPPARERFLAFREALTAAVEAGAPMLQQFFDWASLCKSLGEEDRILAWFDTKGPRYEPPRDLAGIVEMQVVPLLRAKGRWADIGRLYRDPLQVVRHQQQMLSRIPMLTAQRLERRRSLQARTRKNHRASDYLRSLIGKPALRPLKLYGQAK